MVASIVRQGKKFLCVLPALIATGVQAQPPDTASMSYRVGYYVGAWLPMLVIGAVFLALFLYLKKKRNRE
jgi:hypothetical protein